LKGIYYELQFLRLLFKPPTNATGIKLEGTPVEFQGNEQHEKSEYSIFLSLADRHVVEFENVFIKKNTPKNTSNLEKELAKLSSTNDSPDPNLIDFSAIQKFYGVVHSNKIQSRWI